MKFRFYKSVSVLGFLMMLAILSSCGMSMRFKPAYDSHPSRNSAPSEIEVLKQPGRLSEDYQGAGGASSKIFFAELQILTETTSTAACESVAVDAFFESSEFEGYLSEFGEVVLNSNENLNSLINVEFRAIGLDEGAFRTSFVDGKSKTKVPYNLKLSFLPNQSIRMRYLNQSVDLRLDKTPIYTVSIVEQKAGCEITHNLNVFSKVSGAFNRPE